MAIKLTAVGAKDIILPFKAIGAEIFPVSNAQEARAVLEKLTQKEAGIILVSEDLMPGLKDFTEETMGEPLPCILAIPGGKRSSGFRAGEIRELIKKAVGVDLFKPQT